MSDIAHLAEAPMEAFGGLSINQLAYLHQHPDHAMRKLIDHECHGRPNPGAPSTRIPCPTKARFKCMAYFSEFTVCDDCRQAADKADAMDRAKKHWEKVCPCRFRDTDKNHPDFPKAQFELLKGWTGDKSLFLYGEKRTGKTRMAFMMLKRAMLRNNYVGVLWPEKLDSMKSGFDTLAQLEAFGRYDVLLLDDCLLTACQNDKLTSWLKNLIDYLMRYNRKFVITSQIGGDDYKEQAGKFKDLETADIARIEALMERIREETTVIPFPGQNPVNAAEQPKDGFF